MELSLMNDPRDTSAPHKYDNSGDHGALNGAKRPGGVNDPARPGDASAVDNGALGDADSSGRLTLLELTVQELSTIPQELEFQEESMHRKGAML